MATRRLFFALWPDMRQRDRMRNFISPVARLVEGRAIERHNWHVTLAYIGEFPEARIDELHEARMAVSVKPFRLRFDRLEFWPRPKIAALVAATVPAELEQLMEDLKGRIFAAGVELEQRTYRPHVTVVRNARQFETQRLAQSAAIQWDSFKLIESISEPGGVIYRPVDQ
ncbi:MAG: RNA 2',3'-cyclic phosphodiesterase [Woeseiaceae bacterium]|nr:RNA 2',3'-cyclic phosphodiesterase [Woeseiaceae bacterium]